MATNYSDFTQDDYEIQQRDVLCESKFRLVRYTVRHRKFAGDWTPPFTREVYERKSAAAVLPYDPHLDKVILIEQFRIGAIANPKNPWLLETVAGIIEDHDESAEKVAMREAEEEAGIKILNLHHICDYFVSPGGSNEFLQLFCGNVDASFAGGVHGLEHENEDIRAFAIGVEDAYHLVQEGKIKTPPAIIAILWLVINRSWLKQLWLTK